MEKASKIQLKKIHDLMRDKKIRDKENLFIAEGLKIVREIINKGYCLDLIAVSNNFIAKKENKDFFQEIKSKSTPIFKADNNDFEKISSLEHSQGVLAIVKRPNPTKEIDVDKEALVVLCDGIQDPGNLGTIIRTSVAFGVKTILVTGETVDIYSPKVIRASSGMLLELSIYEYDMKRIASLKKQGYRILVSQANREKGKDIKDIEKLQGRIIIAFGSEGKGVSSELSRIADDFFYIPILKKAESLNVGAAAAIALYIFGAGPRTGPIKLCKKFI